MALSAQALPYTWDWDTPKARKDFERHYDKARQAQLRQKLDDLCQHAMGDVEKIAGSDGYYRLKCVPDRIIFYVGHQSKTVWVVNIGPRGKGTYDI